jgi:hippurate hydrolase
MNDIPWLREAAERAPAIVALRRALHRRPETGLDLPETAKALVRALTEAAPGIEITEGEGCTSVVAVIRGTAPGRGERAAVLLRADMDALPVQEESGLAFASEIPGIAHVCGHDLHSAALVGAAGLLHAHRDRLAGDVVLMFQPGEEGYNGARAMLEEGVLEAAGSPVRSAYALHVAANLPCGLVASRPGPLMAAASDVDITVRGQGGHGSQPHLTRDPLHAAAALVTSLYAVTPRNRDPQSFAVFTLGTLRSGTARGAVPETAELSGTLRAFDDAVLERFRQDAVRVAEGVAAVHDVRVDLSVTPDYPVVVNDGDRTGFALDTARALFGEAAVTVLDQPVLAAEDFSRVLEAVPGAMLFVGAHDGDGDPFTAPGNHAPGARFSETVLPGSAALLASLAARELDPEAADG